jgi:putative nucleotidyltransferase with HDIG domain/PAS domain S-box-containing protein
MNDSLKITRRENLRHFFIALAVIFISLTLVTGIILTLLYSKALLILPTDVSDSVPRIVSDDLFVILAVLLLSSVLAAWMVTRTSVKNRQVKKRLELDEHVLKAVNDLIYVHDTEGKCIYASEANTRNNGHTQDESNGYKTLYEELVKPRLRSLKEAGETTFETIYAGVNQSPVPVEVFCKVIKSSRQNYVLSIMHDITERKRNEEELKQSSERLRKAMNGTINSMAYIAEARDPYTAGHQQRVARLATAIARELNISEEKVEGIRVAGILHDIGKISVPAEILSKPGCLRKNEFNLVKDHSEVGYTLLKAIDFSQPVAQIVLQHHERMDGSGYPNGLTGDNIMLEARIMGIADVIESMSSHRPYRPAYNIDKALLEIVMQKGILYDAQIVDACVRLFNEKGFTFN